VTQNYDNIGRTASILSGGIPYLSSLSYNAAGETLGFTMGNQVQGAFTYNDHLQLASLRYFKSGSAQDILNLGYDYTSAAQPNNNGQIQAMHYFTQPGVEDATKSEAFTYDAWLRLKAAQTITVNANTAGTWSLTWGYDRLGNRKQQTLTGGNLPGGIGQPSFTIDETTNRINGLSYDSAGNLTGDGTFTYAYDGANRMKQAQQVASPNTVTSSTYFGPLRIKKVVGATTTRYLYSGSKPIAEYVNGSATPSKEYIYAGSTLLATIAGTSPIYHHPDHLSNRAETDATGAVVRTAGHFPFGESWYEGSSDPLKFTSYIRDSGTGETGLDYAMFRHYSSRQGRFMSADLLAGHTNMPQTINRYSYGNDPVNLADPLGLDQVSVSFSGNCVVTSYYSYQSVPPKDSGSSFSFALVLTGTSTFCFSSSGGSVFGTLPGSGGGDRGGTGGASKAKTCIFIAGLMPDARTAIDSARGVARGVLLMLEIENNFQSADMNSAAVGISGGGAFGLDAGGFSVGAGGSASVLVAVDVNGNSGLVISPFQASTPSVMSTNPGWSAGFAANIGGSVLASPKLLDALSGESAGVQAAAGPVALDIGTNGTQLTLGLGVGARLGGSFNFGPSIVIPFCD
jgi:RHS repeat-associated protein